ncbi:signal peptidase I [Parvibacter caecicola]|uniref:Signal peptidase I n=1 Tax=Parvibacter caecicola TaxID=747645 RepID=A0A3N0ADU4_9ACTN|nr:signal peptidase I [Parvibacter caecicola]TJW12530.1 signal peptidase I [Parvibacter caecicola]
MQGPLAGLPHRKAPVVSFPSSPSWLRTLVSAALTLQLAVALALAAATTGAPAVGYTPFAIVSGSMEPAIPTGSMVWVDATPAAQLKPGDVCAFDGAGQVVVHRVAEVGADGRLRTKGDANDAADAAPVSPECVRGKVALHLPLLGQAVMWGQERRGAVAAILIGINGALAAAAAAVAIVQRVKGAHSAKAKAAASQKVPQGHGKGDRGAGRLRCRVRRGGSGVLHRKWHRGKHVHPLRRRWRGNPGHPS